MFEQNGIITINSKNKGPICTLVACTHGDELLGYYIFEYLLKDFDIKNKIKNGTINFVIGNYKGMNNKKRFIDKDFNRIWDFKDKDKNTYEYKRALEIKDILEKSDYVFDLHSTTNPSPIFIIPGKKVNNNLFDGFDIDFVVKDILDFLHGTPLIKYVESKNSNAQCMVLEGYINTQDDIKKSIKNVLYYLYYYGFIDLVKEEKKYNFVTLTTVKGLYAHSMDIKFLYSDNTKSFQKIKKGTQILSDNGNILISDDDYYTLMPTQPRYIGEEIGYLLKKIKFVL